MYENVAEVSLNEKKKEDLDESRTTLKMSLNETRPIADSLSLKKVELNLDPKDTQEASRRQIEEKLGADFMSMIKGIKSAIDAVPKIGTSDEFVQLIIKHGGVWIFARTLLDMTIYLCPYVKNSEEKAILEEVIDKLMAMYLKRAKERKEWEDHVGKEE